MSKAIRNATLGLIALAVIAGASYASGEEEGIEVLGIEVLSDGTVMVHTHVIAPQGAMEDSIRLSIAWSRRDT